MGSEFNKQEAVDEAQAYADRLARTVVSWTANLNAAKKAHQAAQERVHSIIRLGEAALQEQQPLFGENGKETEHGSALPADAEATGASGITPETDASPADTSWRDRPLKDAISVGVVVNALEAQPSPVVTMGQFADWQNTPGNTLTNLAGVGQAKADKAADQLAEFWKANPQYQEALP